MRFVVAALWLAAAEAGPPLIVYYESRPPYTERQGEALTGLLGQPAIAALQRAGIDFLLRESPFNRHMAIINRNLEPACAIGRFKTAEREALGKFSEPFYRDQAFVGLIRTGSPRLHNRSRFDTLLSDPRLVVLARENYSYGSYADRLLPQAAARIVRTPATHADMARMVLRQMADLMLLTADEADSVRQSQPGAAHELAVLRFDDMRQGETRHFYCSKQVEDALLQKLNAQIPPLPD